MNDYKKFLEIINSEIDRVGKNDFTKEPKNLYEPIKYTLESGGKRIRPVLCLMAAEMFGEDYQNCINTALGIEIFHNFTLVHDDIMDKSDKRREKNTVHKQWNENIGILSGDAMTALSLFYLIKTKKNLEKILDIFTKVALEVCEGQQYDMDFESTLDVSENQYLEMIRLKTAVMLAASLKSGAVLANANEEETEKLYDLGVNLGIAFQLQDDLLDVFGDPQKFKKTLCCDIVDNKKTYLLIKALSLANQTQKKELTNWFTIETFDKEDKITAVKNIYKELDIEHITNQKIESYFREANRIFESLNVAAEKKQFLKEGIDMLKGREY